MLGKTNITTLSEGGTATEVEDFSWIKMESGTYADIEKAICENGYLAALTADGSVLFTKDGEYWETMKPDYTDCRLNDITWDGRRFLLVGSCKDDTVNTDDTVGLVLATADFRTVEKLQLLEEKLQLPEYASGQYCAEYFAVLPQNGKYVLVSRGGKQLYLVVTDFINAITSCAAVKTGVTNPRKFLKVSTAKNADTIIVYTYVEWASGANTAYAQVVVKIKDGESSPLRLTLPNTSGVVAAVFECKSVLYVQFLIAVSSKYPLYRITESGETGSVSEEQNYMFRNGVYFGGCQLFINSHDMLIVRKNENIADKTVDDLIEIAPEDTMEFVLKAFGQLYIFGKRGLILKSSAEASEPNTVLVQTLSAKRALGEAKSYADAKYRELEERIARLETQASNE